MKIGIIGTRGIPNYYGGFEQFTQFVAPPLVEKGHEVWVYTSSSHPYKQPIWNGVSLIHKYDPEKSLGTAGQFIYDLNCILDSRTRNFDLILQLGYTSSSVWSFLFPKDVTLVTNMDGLEWKRTKYSKAVRRFLMNAEKWAALSSDSLIADSVGIQKYLWNVYKRRSTFIAYGATLFSDPDVEKIRSIGFEPYSYSMAIARMEPENNMETIIRGYLLSGYPQPLLLIGSTENKYGRLLKSTYAGERIRFLGPLYDIEILNNMRHFSHFYFHGHSVGGTNPSLLEAMASQCLILAHSNIFNRSVLHEDAYYFSKEEDIAQVLNEVPDKEAHMDMICRNNEKIIRQYTWDHIVDSLENHLTNAVRNFREKNSFLPELRFWLVNAMLATILISALNINSYCIFAILFLTLIDGNWKKNLLHGFTHPVFISFLLLFLIECAGMLYTTNMKAGVKNVETSAGLIALPFILITGKQFFSRYSWKIMRVYCLSLAFTTVYCIVHAIIQHANTGDSTSFYYHELLMPINHHAVYFSVFLLIGITILFAEIRHHGYRVKNTFLRLIGIAWFFFFIILLASKIMLVAAILLITVQTLLTFKGKTRLIASGAVIGVCISCAVIISLIDNPIRERFRDLFSGNPELYMQKKFSTDIYFNGLQFRLLNLRFGWEILKDNHALLLGVSPGDAQQLLNEKFISAGMYSGDPQRKDSGFLNYNFHNQFLQAFVESGAAGLLVLLFNLALLLVVAFRRNSINAICTLLLILIFFLTESVLERQYGVFLYAFFPLFLMTRTLRSLSPNTAFKKFFSAST